MYNNRYISNKLVIAIVGLLMIISLSGCRSNKQTNGEKLYKQAIELEQQKSFSKASYVYGQALSLLIDERNTELVNECSEAMQRLTVFKQVYPYTSDQIKDIFSQYYPEFDMESFMSSNELEYYVWDNEKHYFYDAISNLKFRYMPLMHADTTAQEQYHNLVLNINEMALEKPEHTWKQYQNPVTYRGTHTVSIPRDKLPEVGTYRVWLPIPINNGAQTQVSIESVTPEEWVKQPPSVDQDIGLLYMEIPLEALKEDLFIEIVFVFTHYQQRFSIDPDNVGVYDKSSELYKKYTMSYGNTDITSEIRKLAKSIAGDETNPYIAARMIYDYIVNNIDYSFMPHFVLWPRTTQTESDYVNKYKRGDCGAQSMYFSALCRSLGIPARATGGWQLFAGAFSDHFWAEFYLPNYGWIPVDTSCAQIALYPKDLSDQDRETFIDFYFGNQDSMRCVVQKDTDTTLIPQAQGMLLLPMAVQTLAVEYSIPNGEIPEILFLDYWAMQCEKLSP